MSLPDTGGGGATMSPERHRAMHPILKLVGRRLLLGLLTLFVVSLIIFFGVALLPGDFATEMLGQSATPQAVAALRLQLGLDVPAHIRYLHWLGNILTGDFGRSLAGNRDIATLVGPRLANTMFLAGFAAVIAVPLAVGLGILAALYRNTLFDRIVNVTTLSSISFPEFFVAYVLILFLSVQLNWLPSLAQVSPETSFWERLHVCFLPALTLTLVTIAHMMRMTRAAIINTLSSPYIEMARLKGVGPLRVIIRHALPNALAPIINVIVVNIAYLIVGVVLVEVVFVYPGLGQLLVDSVSRRDLPVVQVASIIFAATYILLNLLADVLAILSNPRLLHPR